MAAPSKHRLRVLYAAGPGDVVATYRDRLQGKEPEFEMSIAFSSLFLEWCEASDIEAHLIAWNSRIDSVRDDHRWIEHRPKPAAYFAGGIRHHLGALRYGLTIVMVALRERPQIVIADSGTTHWIVLSLLRLFGIPVIAVMHSTLWPAGFRPARHRDSLILAADGFFFRRCAAATVCVSPECERQVREVARALKGPIYQCRAQFRRGFFDRVHPPPAHEITPFRILFVGRVEENKGVFLILSIAETLEREMAGRFTWRIVGSGSASTALARQAAERGLDSIVEIAGRLSREETLEAYGWAHANIVPTTSGYMEGLAMTAAEAILAGRPVVLSSVVPAGEILGAAAIRVAAGDVAGFVDAFRTLALDRDHYERCRSATTSVQEQFYRRDLGLGEVLGEAMRNIERVSLTAHDEP